MVKVAPLKSYSAGSLLCCEGDFGNSCFILVHGQVEILRKMNGNPRVLARLEKGAMVGQMSLVDGAPRSATVRAVDECVVLELERVVFERLLQASNPVAMQFQDQIAVAGIRQLRMANQRLASLLASKQAKPRPRRPQNTTLTQPKGERDYVTTTPVNEELDDNGVALAYMHTALKEWGMSMHELDQVEVGQPIGMITQQELKARKLD
ncbi:MAG TPA: cyclic nucleotide-binding domain-containing protein [Myxococcales bacterium]|nr:cyclic nucleotide-binding domain-containing protein [Myxococcales bacterium]HIN85958.1 cyclic nucleotide-binding domain-containing protein [Myxococcales bacterium]